jgi:hypothetical protein
MGPSHLMPNSPNEAERRVRMEVIVFDLTKRMAEHDHRRSSHRPIDHPGWSDIDAAAQNTMIVEKITLRRIGPRRKEGVTNRERTTRTSARLVHRASFNSGHRTGSLSSTRNARRRPLVHHSLQSHTSTERLLSVHPPRPTDR